MCPIVPPETKSCRRYLVKTSRVKESEVTKGERLVACSSGWLGVGWGKRGKLLGEELYPGTANMTYSSSASKTTIQMHWSSSLSGVCWGLEGPAHFGKRGTFTKNAILVKKSSSKNLCSGKMSETQTHPGGQHSRN